VRAPSFQGFRGKRKFQAPAGKGWVKMGAVRARGTSREGPIPCFQRLMGNQPGHREDTPKNDGFPSVLVEICRGTQRIEPNAGPTPPP